MNRKTYIFGILIVVLAALAACSGKPAAKEAARPLDTIHGKAQVLIESGGASETALNAGGSSVYLWDGLRRYRLFLRTPAEIVHGYEYVAEGIDAQKLIDELGDPDEGKTGYPIQSSCERVVTSAWKGVSFDEIAPIASLVRARVKRYPARPLFLVTRIRAAETGTASRAAANNAAEDANVREVDVAAEKQRASLIEGPSILPAPLWQPAGGTAHCRVTIDTKGKIAELGTGEQLCEAVPWSQFRYQPPVERGQPVKVNTEVDVRFEPRGKASM